MFILDTNVISELRHGKPQQSAEVRAWAAGQPSNRLFLSAISILELEIGIRPVEGGLFSNWAAQTLKAGDSHGAGSAPDISQKD